MVPNSYSYLFKPDFLIQQIYIMWLLSVLHFPDSLDILRNKTQEMLCPLRVNSLFCTLRYISDFRWNDISSVK